MLSPSWDLTAANGRPNATQRLTQRPGTDPDVFAEQRRQSLPGHEAWSRGLLYRLIVPRGSSPCSGAALTLLLPGVTPAGLQRQVPDTMAGHRAVLCGRHQTVFQSSKSCHVASGARPCLYSSAVRVKRHLDASQVLPPAPSNPSPSRCRPLRLN